MSLAASPLPNTRTRSVRHPRALPRRSPFLTWGFERYLTTGFGLRGGYVARHFHAVRLAKGSAAAFPADRPIVFYLNHSGWWDPLIAFLLARRVVPGRHPYAPIEQAALDRYPLLDRIGLFGVEKTPRGAKRFFETASAVLARSDASLWLTPEGRFTDPRSRPVTFEPGLGLLAERIRAIFVPVAIEYRFRHERLPEALARFGEPIDSAVGGSEYRAWTRRFEAALEATLDALDADAGDPGAFETILGGKEGVGPFYDLTRRLRAVLSGRRYVARHDVAAAGGGR